MSLCSSFLAKSDNPSRNLVAFRRITLHSASVRKLAIRSSQHDNVQQVLTTALTSRIPRIQVGDREQVFRDPKLHVHVLSTLLSNAMSAANYEPRVVSKSSLAQRDAVAFEEFYSNLYTLFPRYLDVNKSSVVDVVRHTERDQVRDFFAIVYAFEGGLDRDPCVTIHSRKLAMGSEGVLRTTVEWTSVCLNSQAVTDNDGDLQDVEFVDVKDLIDRINLQS